MKKLFKKTSNLLLFVSCSMIILYTIASFLLQFYTGYEISSTLTTAFYSYWSVEILSLMAIKNTKTKYQNQNEEPEEEEIIED